MTPLPEELARLLEEERTRTELPEARIDEAWGALASRLSVAPLPQAPSAPPASGSSWAGILKAAGIAAIAFSAGVGAGRAWPRSEAAPTPAEVTATPASVAPATASAPSSAAPPSASAPSTSPAVPVVVATEKPAPSSRAASPSASAAPLSSSRGRSVLAEERVLVEGARTALLRGRPGDALSLADKHGAQFPDGELAEDRDFLAITALRDLGRTDEARGRAQAFLVRYPRSALREGVESFTK